MATYQQILLDNAFGNFRNILYEITLSPAMGRYLDMVNNDKPNPARGTEPNENYARELLQLFSIGVVKLNQDGTPILQGGKPVPSYGQDEIEGFAHVFTGWTYPVRPGASGQTHNPSNFEGLMVAVAAQHDTGQKTLLNGVKLPAGQTAAKDLNDAIDNVFSHPNLGPFIGRQLIAHLVTSNPSTAYVARVAAAFANNGQGVRGDMKAVLRAILLDAEARGDAKTANTYGKLIEPAMFTAGVIRALNGQSDGVYLRAQGAGLGQDVFNAESVFSFYPPDLPLPGNATLVGPEFGVYNSSTSLARIAFLERVVMGGTIAADATVAGATGTSIDLSRWQSLAGNASNLIDQLAVLLVPGTLPGNTRNAILNYVNGIAATDTLGRTRAAAYFLAATTLHQVQR